MTQAENISEIRHIIGVASGKGGVGKSTVSAHLACALNALGLKVGLLDADIYGPSQAHMFGLPDGTRPEVVDGKKMLPIVAHGVALMSMGFLTTEETPLVWRGPMASGALIQLLNQTQWGSLDVLVVDLPPGTGDIQLTLSQKAKLAGAVVVTTPQDIALLDAQKAIAMFEKVQVPVVGLIENMSYHVCPGCGIQSHLFGDGGGARLSSRYGVPVIAQLPLDRQWGEACDQGRPLTDAHPLGALMVTAAQQLLESIAQISSPAPIIQDSDE